MLDRTSTHLRFVGREVAVVVGEAFQADGPFGIATADDVLDLEVGELGVEAEFLYGATIVE